MVLSRRWLGPLCLGLLAGCDACEKQNAVSRSEDATSAPEADVGIRDGGVVNTLPLPTASVTRLLNPDGLPAYTGPTGSVEGTVRVVGDRAPPIASDFSRCPEAARTWGRAFREGTDAGARTLADAIVVVTGYRGFFLPEARDAREVRIDGCAYTTRTATMTFGQALDVRNVSKDFWTPVLEPGKNMVLRMATPNGDPVRLYPKEPGHYLLLDRDRKYAVVDVYAFLHPLHTATDTSGHYRIDGLPLGKVKVSATHPRLGTSSESELVVQAGVVSRVDFELSYAEPDAGASVDAGPRRPVVR